jgi:flagellar hook-basal body complex protein FliE
MADCCSTSCNPAWPEGSESGSVGNILQSFSTILKDQMGNIDNLQAEASQAQQTYAVGGDIELHNVILATEKADMALQLAMQVRNKVIAAYQEISHMTV